MTNKPLNAMQITIWRFIADYQKRESCPPTYREIADGVGLKSPSTIKHHLKALARAKVIRFSDRYSRAVQLLKQPPKAEKEAVE